MTLSRSPELGQHGPDQSVEWIEPTPDRGALTRVVSALVSRPWVMPLAIALALAAAVAYLATAHDVYKAEADVMVTPVPDASAIPGFGLILASSDPARAAETVARLVRTPAVAQRVKAELKLHKSVHELLGDVEAKPIAQSNLVAIAAKANAPAAAARLADAFGNALIDYRTARVHRLVDVAIQDVDARLKGLGQATASQRGKLLARSTGLRTLRDAPDPSLQLASTADPPSKPVSPRPLLTVAAAIVAGGILGVLGVLALECVDPRLWREEQLSASYRLPILARIPRQRARVSAPLGPDRISQSAAAGYRLLRANLRSAAQSGSGRHAATDLASSRRGRAPVDARGCVMVTSPSIGDAKTTTALNLAATLAGGGQRVMLIEADTEHPSIGKALGLSTADGLGSVLAEDVFLRDALVPVELGSGRVEVLLADPPARRGDTLFHPAGVRALLDEASARADWVVVDLPPLHRAPDMLPLVRAAGDPLAAVRLIVAVRLRYTNLRDLGRLAELLAQQEVMPGGFVLTGTRSRADPRDGGAARSRVSEPSASPTDGWAAGTRIPTVPSIHG